MLEGLLHSPAWLLGVERVVYRDEVRVLVRVRKAPQMAAIIRACIPTSVNGIKVIVEQQST